MTNLENADIRAIVAVNKNGGIGMNGKLPWNKNKGDLAFFRQQTEGGIVIFGRNTIKASPHFEHLLFRKIHIWQRFPGMERKPSKMLEDILYDYKNWPKPPTIWIGGGAETYRTFAPWVKSVSVSVIRDYSDCDTYFPFRSFFPYIKG